MDLKNLAQCLLSILFLPCFIFGERPSLECQKEIENRDYLDIAVEIINKAKETTRPKGKVEPLDCSEIPRSSQNMSGIFRVFPKSRALNGKSVEVYCDMETDGGGWTLIQRRGNFLRPREYFFQDWEAYKKGFGDIDKDFWLGNDNIFALSNQKLYSLRIDMRDVDVNERYAVYDTFWIDDEDHKYALHIKGFRGDAGDSMITHDNRSFTTKDRDNDLSDTKNCAHQGKGGWWYSRCYSANLNGLYLKGQHESYADGIVWNTWKGTRESLGKVEIKIRPKDFQRLPYE